MGAFIKKDLLVFWRDRKEILISLILPIILIVILNFAFSGLFSDDKEIQLTIGFVQEDDVAAGVQQFKTTLEDMEMSVSEKEAVSAQSTTLQPVHMVEEFLNNPDMKEWVTATELTEKEAIKQVENGELDAILKVPNGYTYHMLSNALLGEKSQTSLKILADEQSTEVTTLEELVQSFTNSLNMQFALESSEKQAEPILPQGGMEFVEESESYTIALYFTIAMGTLFPLFIAHTVSVKTVTEKRERVFNRILLTNSNPFHYLIGKIVSTLIIIWLQVAITFTIIQLILNVFPGKSLEFWIGLIAMFTAYTIAIAGLSALFTTITLYLQDSNAASGLFMLIVMTFGVLGGSFFPLDGLPEFMQMVGEYTPNGLTQTAVIDWVQFRNWSAVGLPLIYLLSFFAVCVVIATSMFPKRGRL